LEVDPGLARIYDIVARAVGNLAIKPPLIFYEALLWVSMYALVHRGMVGPCGGYDRLDLTLAPFLEADLKAGRIAMNEAQQLVAEFMMKRCIPLRADSGS
jgi:pyruvate-formate lyase